VVALALPGAIDAESDGRGWGSFRRGLSSSTLITRVRTGLIRTRLCQRSSLAATTGDCFALRLRHAPGPHVSQAPARLEGRHLSRGGSPCWGSIETGSCDGVGLAEIRSTMRARCSVPESLTCSPSTYRQSSVGAVLYSALCWNWPPLLRRLMPISVAIPSSQPAPFGPPDQMGTLAAVNVLDEDRPIISAPLTCCP